MDWWCIPPGGYEGAHYAVWPPELLVRPIKAMCPLRVCTTCGKPSERIVEDTPAYQAVKKPNGHVLDDPMRNPKGSDGQAPASMRSQGRGGLTRQAETVGWTDCGHNTWRNGRVLDPFGGSGTTAMVATGHGRDCLSIDLDERNEALAYERLGMLHQIWDPTSSLFEAAA